MDITQLAKRPELVKLEITDEDIVKEYGEPVSFWMLDHIDVSTYFSFYKFQQNQDSDLLMDVLRKIVLREDGSRSIADDAVLPVNLTLSVLVKINEFLGKSNTKATGKKTGSTQS
jgi:hypothetical protein